MNRNQHTMLWLADDPRERVCLLSLEAHGHGYIINVAHGHQTSLLQCSTEEPIPMAYEPAKRLYDHLLAARFAQGYTVEQPRTSQAPMDLALHRLRPWTPKFIDETSAEPLLLDREWCLQENFVGQHLLISCREGAVVAIDRQGTIIPLPLTVAEAVTDIGIRCILEGMLIGNAFVAFDLAHLQIFEFRTLPYDVRLGALRNLKLERSSHLSVAEVAFEHRDKLEMLGRLRREQKKGFILKRLDGHAPVGGSTCDGDILQCTF